MVDRRILWVATHFERLVLWTATAIITGIGMFVTYFAISQEPHHFYMYTTPPNLGVTMEGFLALKPGIKREEVQHVLTSPSKLVGQVGPQETYVWEDSGRTIMVVFDNDRLTGKIQAGL